MPFLIDGNNFIGQTSPYGLKDPRSKYHLVSQLLIFQKLQRTRVFIVFDGPPDLNLIDEKIQKEKFSIHYPPPDQNADWIIKEIILKQTDLRRFFVVSSDREIRLFAQSKGAKSLSCLEFNKELKSILEKNRRSSETEKRSSQPSPLEIKQWLKIFKKRSKS